jgi:hypothetical protein
MAILLSPEVSILGNLDGHEMLRGIFAFVYALNHARMKLSKLH